MDFRIRGLSPDPFRQLYGMSDDDLSERGVKRYIAGEDSRLPDRIEIRDSKPGERFLLLNHIHQPANSPYRASHAIFVREGAEHPYDRVNAVPEALRIRLLSLRGFDADGMLIEADVTQGTGIEGVIERFFSNPELAYIHAHNAKEGCFHALIERA